MVFSLFRRSEKADPKAVSDASNISGTTDRATDSAGVVSRLSGRRAAQEAARLTAEKIDQIESEMIADVDDRDLPSNARTPIDPPPLSPPHEDDEEVRRALAKLRKKARRATTEGKRKPTAAELLAELTLREATRTGTVADVLAADQMTLMRDPDPDPQTVPNTSQSVEAGSEQLVPDAVGAALTDVSGAVEKKSPNELAINVIDGDLPSDIEEAAILYSNAQYDAACSVLEHTLTRNEYPSFRALNWFMLFDLHRVTGDRSSFERLAMAYADEVEKSPPGWSDELLAPQQNAAANPGVSPSNVSFSALVADEATKLVEQVLRAATNKRDCSVDFSSVQALTTHGATELTRLFDSFGGLDHPLTVTDIDTLLTVAKGQTDMGSGDGVEAFWQLALTCLRLKGRQSEFDDLSIDYCVKFEISPPPWQPYPGQLVLRASQESADHAAIGEDVTEPDPPGDASQVVLRGDVCGRIDAIRSTIQALAADNETIFIECRKLRRMDFIAAGELLNEQLALQAKSRILHFHEPNYLVYALMYVMGLQDKARITCRNL